MVTSRSLVSRSALNVVRLGESRVPTCVWTSKRRDAFLFHPTHRLASTRVLPVPTVERRRDASSMDAASIFWTSASSAAWRSATLALAHVAGLVGHVLVAEVHGFTWLETALPWPSFFGSRFRAVA